MPYRSISADLKQRALWLLSNGYLPDELHAILNVSRCSVQQWADNLAVHGHIVPPPNVLQGRPHNLNNIQMFGLIGLIMASLAMFLDELQDWLALEHDVLISTTVLHMNIRNAGLTYKLLRRRAVERDEVAREQWKADVRANFVAAQIVWTDESSKDDRTIYRHYGRAPVGHRAVIDTQFVRGERYSILPAMTTDGYIAVRIVLGSVEGGEFFSFIVEEVVRRYTLSSLLQIITTHGALSSRI